MFDIDYSWNIDSNNNIDYNVLDKNTSRTNRIKT